MNKAKLEKECVKKLNIPNEKKEEIFRLIDEREEKAAGNEDLEDAYNAFIDQIMTDFGEEAEWYAMLSQVGIC